MNEKFTPEVEAKPIDSAADSSGEAQFAEAVSVGEEALLRGESLTHEQVGERLQRFLHR